MPLDQLSLKKNESAWDSWMRFIQQMLVDWQAPLILCSVISFIAILFLLPLMYALTIVICILMFYLLFLLFPWHFMVWLWAVCALCIGIYLLVIPLSHENRKWYRAFIGIILIAGSIIGFLKAYSYTYVYNTQKK